MNEGGNLALSRKVDDVFIIQRCLGQSKPFGWRLAILAGQNVIVDRAHDVEDFGNITRIVWGVAIPYLNWRILRSDTQIK
jgi:hypothetical protein